MAKSEKVAYILEQVRLCLDRKDFVRAQASDLRGALPSLRHVRCSACGPASRTGHAQAALSHVDCRMTADGCLCA